MIEVLHPSSGESGLALKLTPNRSAGPGELVACYAGIGTVALGVAGMASAQGNVFAPVFAVLVVGLVGAAFLRVRQALGREETIDFTEDAVVVRRKPGAADIRFPTGWVRVEAEPGVNANAHPRLLLGSHGRRVEVGAFLADGEREELQRRIIEALATVKGAARDR